MLGGHLIYSGRNGAQTKYPAPLGRNLPRNRMVPLEELCHASLLCSGGFDFIRTK